MARRTAAGPVCTLAVEGLPPDRRAASREIASMLSFALSQSAERGSGWRVEPDEEEAGAVARLVDGERVLEVGVLHGPGGPPFRRYALWASAWADAQQVEPAGITWAAVLGGAGMTLLGLVATLRALEQSGAGWGRMLFGAVVAVGVGMLTAAMIRRQVADRASRVASRRAGAEEASRLQRVAEVVVASLRTQERVTDVAPLRRSAG